MHKCSPVICCIIFSLFITACNRSSDEPKNHSDPTKPAKVELLQNGKIQPVVLKPVNGVVQHTDFIGTSDQPTFDGGIINAADGLAINTVPENVSNRTYQNIHAKSQAKTLSHNVDPESQAKIQPAFHDNWATSARVKSLLHKAAQDGKLAYVLDKTEKKGLPASVATVPMIESNYQNDALSSKGAAGAWQLMPSTAKDYGVAKDERYKFHPSTEAALNLLNDLHTQFGNWELAFAAYNAGTKRVQDALRKNPKAQSVQELELPRETKDYVKRIMAINVAMESL